MNGIFVFIVVAMYEEEELLAKPCFFDCGKINVWFLLIVTEYFPKYFVIIRTSADALPLLLLHKWDLIFSFKIHELKQKNI